MGGHPKMENPNEKMMVGAMIIANIPWKIIGKP